LAIPAVPPRWFWFPFEGQRAFFEWLSYFPVSRLLEQAPRGDGHPVLVLPGFMAGDESTRILRSYLKSLGYSVHPWLQGRNLGSPGIVRERLVDRAVELHERHGRKLSIVGWSLGGVYARTLAKHMPDHVRQVITLGSPFGDRTAPSVPSTAIFSKSDGITGWETCRERPGPRRENIEVPGSHCGLGWNALVLWAIADRLAQGEGEWKAFARDGWRSYAYR
jgi:pimeloyl-ACP methyl ester carboxylesterase